jgi:hypothetical protein
MTLTTNASAGGAAPARAHNAATPANPLLRLGELASLQPGYPFACLQKNPDGKLALLQKKDVLAASGPIQPQGLEQVLETASCAASIDAQLALQADDLILARHAGIWLVRVLAEPAAMTICTEPLWRIRILSPTSLLPSYLAWYLNTDAAQTALGRYLGQGSLREGFNSMAVRLPPMAIQNDIAALFATHQTRDAAAQALRTQKKQQLDATLLKMSCVTTPDAARLLGELH